MPPRLLTGASEPRDRDTVKTHDGRTVLRVSHALDGPDRGLVSLGFPAGSPPAALDPEAAVSLAEILLRNAGQARRVGAARFGALQDDDPDDEGRTGKGRAMPRKAKGGD